MTVIQSFGLRPPDPNRLQTLNNEPSKFKKFMRGVGRFARSAGQAVLPMIPGGSVLQAAMSGFGAAMGGGSFSDDGMSPYDMLNIQQSMLQEARTFTLLSNIMKIRHDAAMNAIRNIR